MITKNLKKALICGMLGCLCYGGGDWLILIAMETCIIMVTFGAGLLEGLLQIAQESLGIFMRS